jgi:hypothetical protein
VELVFYQEALGAGEDRTLFVRAVDGDGCREASEPAAFPRELASGVAITLVDTEGTTHFEPRQVGALHDGPVRRETSYRGEPGRRVTMAASVSSYPAVQAVRYRIEVRQLADGESWKRLRVRVPQALVRVRRQRQMGATVHTDPGKGTSVTLIPDGNHAVDRGVGRRWEIWGYGDPTRLASPPLRPRVSPDYLHSTGALGLVATRVPDAWEGGFERSFQRLFARRDADPANFGWRHYGDFADREHGPEYYGYLNQEYDPATALTLAYARTGVEVYLERAVDLAYFFRDMGVSPEGGVYQHRATLHAAQAHLIRLITPGLLARLRAHPSFRPSDSALVAVITDLYGPSARSPAVQILGRLGDLPPNELAGGFAEAVATRLVEQQSERLRARISARPGRSARPMTMRGVFEAYAEGERIRELGFRNVDEAFRPFFQRYGGSWAEFPGFHVDLHPVPGVRHTGSHSLVEMLVLTYFFTGDEGLRDAALKVARHHLEEIVPREMERNHRLLEGDQPLFTRSLAWPLINLVALSDLTEHREPDLHAQLRLAATRLAVQLATTPVERCEGSTSAGLTMEALARFHVKTGNEAVAQGLVDWARHWSSTQWNRRLGAFQYRYRQSRPAWKSLTALCLLGLAYAADLEPADAQLRSRVLEARDSLLTGDTDYAKEFAMRYRSTARALEIIRQWEAGGDEEARSGER